MADVVGTAFVRIKALTNNLAKEIESNVKKGMKGAKLDKIAQDEGESSGEAYVDGFSDTAKKSFKKKSKDIFPSDSLFGEFNKSFRDIKESFDQLEFDFDFDGLQADIGDTDRDTQGWLGRMRSDIRDITDNMDGSFADSLGNLGKRFQKLGSSGGGGLGILKSKMALLVGVIVGALPYIQDAGAAVLAYGVGLVAQIGFLVTAAGGLGVAAGAALGSIAIAALPIFLAFKAQTPALETFKDSMKAAGEEFQKIGAAAQEHLLPGLDAAVFALGDLIPMFIDFGHEIGKVTGDFAEYAAEVIVGVESQRRLQAILKSSTKIVGILFKSILNLGNVLSGIWVAAIPASERFVEILGDVTSRWASLVSAGLQSGSLTRTFDIWFERARVLGSALSNLTGALFDILQVGANSSDNVFTRFDEWAERFRTFTESEAGQNKFKLIFDNALAVMHEVNGVLAELFGGLGRLEEVGGVDSLVTGLQNFRDIIPELKEQWGEWYDVIKNVVGTIASNVWENAKKAFEELKEPLSNLVDEMIDLFETMNDSGAFELFLVLLTDLAKALTVLLQTPGLGTLLAYLLAFNGIITAVSLVLGPFAKLFTKLGPVFAVVVKATVALGGAISALFGFGIAGGIAIAIGIIVAAVVAVVAVWKNWDTIMSAFNVVWDAFYEALLAVGRFFKRLPQTLETVIGFFKRLGSTIGKALGGAASAVGSFATKLPGVIGRALGRAASAVGGFGLSVAKGIVGGLSKLPGLLATGLGKLGGLLGKALSAAGRFAFEALRATIHRALQGILLIFIGIPVLIFLALKLLGTVLIKAFKAAFEFLKRTLPGLFKAVLNFFQDLPGNIVEALSNLGEKIASFFTDTAWPAVSGAVSTAITSTIQFFKDLPGNVVSALNTFGDTVRQVFFDALDKAKTAVSNGIRDIGKFFSELPGKIGGFATDIYNSALSIGGKIISGIVDGLSGAGKAIGNAAGSLLTGVSNVIGNIKKGIFSALDRLIPDKIAAVKVDFGPLGKHKLTPEINLPNNPFKDLGLYSIGGFVGKTAFSSARKVGTDSIPALLTPGEFVLRRSVAQSIPPEILHSLNDGDPRLLALLSSLNNNRPGSSTDQLGSVSSAGQSRGGGGVVFEPGAVLVNAQGVSASEVVAQVNTKLGWQLTTRGDR